MNEIIQLVWQRVACVGTRWPRKSTTCRRWRCCNRRRWCWPSWANCRAPVPPNWRASPRRASPTWTFPITSSRNSTSPPTASPPAIRFPFTIHHDHVDQNPSRSSTAMFNNINIILYSHITLKWIDLPSIELDWIELITDTNRIIQSSIQFNSIQFNSIQFNDTIS